MKTHTVNSVRLATFDRGYGAPLLLVHGFPLDHSMWYAQTDALAASYRVIAPDLRGFGRSEVTEGTVSMEQMADDLAALLAALGVGEPVVFCGLSMGGYVAWQFWKNHRSLLRGLVLCDTRAVADTPVAAAARLAMADRVLAEGPAPLVDAMMPKLFADETLGSRPEVVETLRGVMLASDPQGIAAAARGMAERPDFTPMLGQIDCPTLVVVGEVDAISPVEEMRAVAEAIPGAQFTTIAGSGHMSPMEKPADVNGALATFLDGMTG